MERVAIMIRHQSKGSPAPPFGLLSFGQGCTLLTMYFKGLRRFGIGGLAIMKDFFSQFVPSRMTRDEMIELADQLRRSAQRTR